MAFSSITAWAAIGADVWRERHLQSRIGFFCEKPWTGIAAIILVAMAFALLWRMTPLSQLLAPDWLADQFRRVIESDWAPVIITATYLVANAVAFPNMALNLALIVALGPLLGVPVALLETLIAGIAAFLIGRRWGGERLADSKVPILRKSLAMIQGSGLSGLVLLRMVPVAPYPVVNLWLGASSVKPGIFVLGTAIGVFPSLVAMGVVGLQLRELFESPTLSNVGILIMILITYACLGWMVKRNLSVRAPDRA